MNFKVNFDEAPTLVSFALVACESFLLTVVLIGIVYFICWEMPHGEYFRTLGVNIVLVLVLAYFNKEK